jgi:hypothetical protein
MTGHGLPALDRRITAAKAALDLARAAANHCPSGGNIVGEATAEHKLDELLELRYAMTVTA